MKLRSLTTEEFLGRFCFEKKIGKKELVPLTPPNPSEINNCTPQQNKPSENVIFFSGFVAGILSRTLTAPADRLKLILQSQSADHRGVRLPVLVRDLYHDGGLPSFWRGNGTNCVKMGPEVALRFLFFDKIQVRLSRNPDSPQFFERLCAGAGAGVLAQTCIYPLEVAKTRLAICQTGAYSGIFDCLKKTWEVSGSRGLYAGWRASALGITPYCATDLAIFFTLKDKWQQRYKGKKLSAPLVGFFGMISSITAQCISYPLLVVRTRQQAQRMDVRYATSFRSPLHTLVFTWREAGVRGLYRGLTMNFCKNIPAISITYIIFEKMKESLSSVDYDDS